MEQSRTLNGTSSRNCPLASPGGKLPDLTALRNRQGWLMRGGDRLVNECSWKNGICSGFLHSTGNLKLLAIATPHQSFLSIGSEVPIDKKSSFPPGEAKNSKDVGEYHSTSRSVASVSGRQVGNPYNGDAKPGVHTIQRGTPPQSDLSVPKCRQIRQLLIVV